MQISGIEIFLSLLNIVLLLGSVALVVLLIVWLVKTARKAHTLERGQAEIRREQQAIAAKQEEILARLEEMAKR